MNDRDNARITLHEDVPLFREAIAFTAAKTGFASQIIEKDYFCTVLLADLARHGGVDLDSHARERKPCRTKPCGRRHQACGGGRVGTVAMLLLPDRTQGCQRLHPTSALPASRPWRRWRKSSAPHCRDGMSQSVTSYSTGRYRWSWRWRPGSPERYPHRRLNCRAWARRDAWLSRR